MALIFDIETDGFLENVTKLHCLVIKDTYTGFVDKHTGSLKNRTVFLKPLEDSAETLIGHNILKYDIPVLNKLYPSFNPSPRVFDTLVATRLIYNNIGDTDEPRILSGQLPRRLFGSHSLEAWGYRLGLMKGEYSTDFKAAAGKDYQKGDEWLNYSPEMLEYCVQDVAVTEALYKKILSENYSQQALDLEHDVATICAKMERTGFPFDLKGAAALYGILSEKRNNILKVMEETFEDEVEEQRFHKTSGKPLKLKVTKFNPGSRKQITDRLVKKYGWVPKVFTPAGDAKIDDEVLATLNYPEAKILAEYFILVKRLGQLAEGDNAWLKLERKGVLHGGYNTNGAVTGRATHSTPNMGQVPAVRSAYGKECRSLFTVPNGFTLVGTDLSGIEARLLAHFMHKYDDGAYATAVISGSSKDGTDIHSVNQRAAGLPTRDSAKTFFYAFLYGAGDEKIGSIVGGGAKQGKKLKADFLAATPALAKLRTAVTSAASRGFLKGLDGRHIHVRSAHAALNSLLQGAGAVISKQWLIEIVKAADARGWVWKEDWTGDYGFCAWVHDEVQIGVRHELAEEFGKMVVEAAHTAGTHFNIKLPIGAEYKLGATWNDTH